MDGAYFHCGSNGLLRLPPLDCRRAVHLIKDGLFSSLGITHELPIRSIIIPKLMIVPFIPTYSICMAYGVMLNVDIDVLVTLIEQQQPRVRP